MQFLTSSCRYLSEESASSRSCTYFREESHTKHNPELSIPLQPDFVLSNSRASRDDELVSSNAGIRPCNVGMVSHSPFAALSKQSALRRSMPFEVEENVPQESEGQKRMIGRLVPTWRRCEMQQPKTREDSAYFHTWIKPCTERCKMLGDESLIEHKPLRKDCKLSNHDDEIFSPKAEKVNGSQLIGRLVHSSNRMPSKSFALSEDEDTIPEEKDEEKIPDERSVRTKDFLAVRQRQVPDTWEERDQRLRATHSQSQEARRRQHEADVKLQKQHQKTRAEQEERMRKARSQSREVRRQQREADEKFQKLREAEQAPQKLLDDIEGLWLIQAGAQDPTMENMIQTLTLPVASITAGVLTWAPRLNREGSFPVELQEGGFLAFGDGSERTLGTLERPSNNVTSPNDPFSTNYRLRWNTGDIWVKAAVAEGLPWRPSGSPAIVAVE